jgi:protocatechuate 3,4-dioxygenase beta subunit
MKSNRRDFLKKGTLGVFAASLIPFQLKANNGSVCDPTTTDILGPFFSEGAPQTSSIVPEDYEGERLFLTGKLSTTDCDTIIVAAVLDFWQADASGAYDNDGFKFRGKIITDENGNYNLETIIPGKYLNGSQYRPSHIHLKVQAEGYDDLVTQIYFEGDVDIPSDPWASSASAINRIISVNSGFAGDWFGTFDVVLSGEGPIGINELQKEYGDLSQNYPNPFNRSTRMFLVLNKNAQTLIEIYDQKGSLIKVLMNQDLAKGRYELNWTDTSLSNGIYTTVWTSDNKLVKTIKMIHQTN